MSSNIPDVHRHGDEPDRETPLAHDHASGGSQWQGYAGQLDPATAAPATWSRADRVAMIAVTLTQRGAALEVSGRVRNSYGGWLDGSDVIDAVAGWLRENGVDPDTGRPGDDDWPGLPVSLLDAPDMNVLTGPHPPAGLPLEDRHRWACRWALTIQAQVTEPQTEMTFAGLPAGMRPGSAGNAGPGLVTIGSAGAGLAICELANTGYRHSPTGFGWGGLGSGCAALARSLLTAALGVAAICPACLGSGKVTWLMTGIGYPVPWQPTHDDLAAAAQDDADPEASVQRCDECSGDGTGIPPVIYQAFKKQVIARIDGDQPFLMPAADVLAWLERQDQSPRLAAAAAGVTR